MLRRTKPLRAMAATERTLAAHRASQLMIENVDKTLRRWGRPAMHAMGVTSAGYRYRLVVRPANAGLSRSPNESLRLSRFLLASIARVAARTPEIKALQVIWTHSGCSG
jgi:hypothetical protein